jgi:hypothetical protein
MGEFTGMVIETKFILAISSLYKYNYKFALGGLVPGDMLRMIEEAAKDDPVEMQNGFQAYDDCSGKSKKRISSLC